MGELQDGWFIMENPNLKWMIWGYPYDLGNLHTDPYGTNRF